MSRKLGVIVFWLVVWQLLAIWVHNDILLVTPFSALSALLERIMTISFWQTVGMSLLRIGSGFLGGFLLAVLLAAFSLRFSFMEELLAPLMRLLKAIPVVSFVVLFLIWWGASFLSVAVCFLVVLPNIYVNTLAGLKNTPRSLLEMAEVFRLPLWNRFFYIYRPALKAFLYSGLNISLGMCWKSGVAAEVIGTPDFSIGEQLYMSKLYLDTAGISAWTAVIVLLSLGFEKLFLFFTDKFFDWKPACRAAGHAPKPLDIRVVCRGISKAYGDRPVLTDFSAAYEPGRTYYLKWESGAGKTTLFRILCGLEQPDDGSVEASGSFGMVFQEDRLCEEYSALCNVELVLGDRERAKAALLELLDEEDIVKPCCQLSGGMKRRVALVRAMESKADCLLLDEPFTGMDARTGQRAEEYIRKRVGDRVLIIATHIDVGAELVQ